MKTWVKNKCENAGFRTRQRKRAILDLSRKYTAISKKREKAEVRFRNL